jgi:hypothetical protein
MAFRNPFWPFRSTKYPMEYLPALRPSVRTYLFPIFHPPGRVKPSKRCAGGFCPASETGEPSNSVELSEMPKYIPPCARRNLAFQRPDLHCGGVCGVQIEDATPS